MSRPLDLAQPLRRAIADQVVGLFNDPARSERPVVRRPDGLFGPGSVAWRVHGDVAAMLVGGVAGLLLQMLHPKVLAGVWDHSNFRADMHGRLRRTARFIAVTTFGGRDEALAAVERVRRIHEQVAGTLPGGEPYRASDPHLLAWVHVTEATSFLSGYVRYVEPRLSLADQDRYFAEMAEVGARLGVDPLPRTRAEARALIEAYRPELAADARTAEVRERVLTQPPASRTVAPLQRAALQAGADLLPPWARRMHGLPHAPPGTRVAALALAQTLRWAFEGARRDKAADSP